MWFNSMQREEPYLDLTYSGQVQKCTLLRTAIQVLHGCRQLVP
jgi:hypothetical protein